MASQYTYANPKYTNGQYGSSDSLLTLYSSITRRIASIMVDLPPLLCPIMTFMPSENFISAFSKALIPLM